MNQLKRTLGIFDATMLGLGSIVGTGIFVSVSVATSVAGVWVLLAILLASLVAICNGLSSAQLAANHPVSGGTYEYGNRWINPTAGFVSGWMFLTAKSASAATAALGLSGYATGVWGGSTSGTSGLGVKCGFALAALVGLTLFSLTGIKRSSRLNTILVLITIGALFSFVVVGVYDWLSGARSSPTPEIDALTPSMSGTNPSGGIGAIWEATALMFVAYTGYGRIATLGEEVKTPRVTIPRAIITTLVCSMVLYISVASVGILTVGADRFAATANRGIGPLRMVSQHFSLPWMQTVIMVGAIFGLLGVLFNLLLGLSRVALAMGRRGDLPTIFSHVSPNRGVPLPSTLLVAVIIGGLIMIGSIRLTWSLSAFAVLVYYGITNVCAIRLLPEERLYSVLPAWIGLCACLALAFCVQPTVWMTGCGWIVVGLIYRFIWRTIPSQKNDHSVSD